MSSTCSSDEAVVANARNRADYIIAEIKADYARFMMEYGTGKVVLTHSVVKTFEQKWLKSCSALEDIIFTLSLDPSKAAVIPLVQVILDEVKVLINENVFMMDKYLVPESDAMLVETPEEQKVREREERRKRMERFQGGEHLDN